MTDSYLPIQYKKGGARSGFTLAELMVTIGIIALLAALLFPVMKGVRDRGKVAVCSNNLKQLGVAFQQYLNDNQQRYPGAGQYQKWANGGHWVAAVANGNNATGKASGGAFASMTDPTDTVGQPYTGAEARPENGALYSYVKNPNVYICPSEPNAEYKRLTYSMNCAIAGLNATVRMKQPSEVVLLVDENNANDGFFWAFNANQAYGAVSTDALSQNHLKGGNLLFCDGHVKFYNYNALPLDDDLKVKENATVAPMYKIRVTGTPRFWDRAFDLDTTAQPAPPLPPRGYYKSTLFGSCANPNG